MIARADTPKSRARFLKACRGKAFFGAVLPLGLELFGKSMSGRFYSGPTLALDIGGAAALAAGSANPDELASFLSFCGCGAVMIDEAACPPPTGWRLEERLTLFTLAPQKLLPEPPVNEELWRSLTFNSEPPSGPIADALFCGQARRDDFYSELCTGRARGKALAWALETSGGEIACTVCAYAIYGGQAYMACGQTAEPLRGQGIGGRLIVRMANKLAAEGLRPVFLCGAERVRFYTRLGFAPIGELALYREK